MLSIILICVLSTCLFVAAWPANDMAFLDTLTRDIVAAAHVPVGAKVTAGQPANSCGFPIVKPGGGQMYPAYWLRDFAMSLGSGFITPAEMRNHLKLAARCQNGPTVRNSGQRAFLFPRYFMPDHISLDGLGSFSPGSYATGTNMGGGGQRITSRRWDDNYEFVHIAWSLFKATRLDPALFT